MDKNSIKKYATWARRELIERVSQKALQYGITENGNTDPNAESVNGKLLSDTEKKQRQALIRKVNEHGYKHVMEEVAYTWFNRFAALRFMEVNGYLPSHVRIFTNDKGEFKPQILSEAIHLDLDGLNMDKVYELKNANKDEELFKYLIIVQCNALSVILPQMFQHIEDYTELLFPDYLLREGSSIQQMIELIPEQDWTDQVQIIGWLYQYYNTEPKDKVFADLKKNIKITKENIPAATQLFTPHWIVNYMVENSLGRLWLEHCPPSMSCGNAEDALHDLWTYYIDEAEQESEVDQQLVELQKQYQFNDPKEIKFIDPCCGSGHILVYAFDVLVQIYFSAGYTERDAVQSILKNNLFGLDIDDRAVQLAYFAVMMKARQYDRRFFNRNIQPHIYSIEESNGITSEPMHDMGIDLTQSEYKEAVKQVLRLIEEMHDAKEYGSIIHITPCDWDLLRRFAVPKSEDSQIHMDIHGEIEAAERLQKIINIAEILAQKYHAVVTNPPYMSMGNASFKIQEYVKKNFPDGKSDLFAVFIERCGQFAVENGYQAMITQHSWMFLSSYEKLRHKLSLNTTINMIHLGARAFDEIGGEVVQTTSFVMQKSYIKGYKGTYCRLIEPTTQQGKEDMFLSEENRFIAQQYNFSQIPGSPIAYWVSKKALLAYQQPNMDSIAQPRHGLATSDNDRFLKMWHEIDFNKGSLQNRCQKNKKWFPISKGGSFRKWYGNLEWVINYENDGKEIKEFAISIYKCSSRTIQNTQFYFQEGLTWSALTSGSFSVRWQEKGALFGSGGYCAFVDDSLRFYILALLNSKVTGAFAQFVSPTLNYEVGHIKTIPVVFTEKNNTVTKYALDNIALSRIDWDSFETSWDFTSHPLVRCKSFSSEEVAKDAAFGIRDMNYIREAYTNWSNECFMRFTQLKSNEEELNRIFIDIYGLRDELSPKVDDKDVTVRKADLQREIKSLISYAVGCMFGRYSLDIPGLIYAGGNFDSKYCRWIAQFGKDANKYIDENGELIEGGWAGCTTWKYDGIRKDGQWVLSSFPPDTDNVIPITDDEYFHNDIVSRFVEFIRVVYGNDTLEENLQFIADALGGKGTSREIIRNYFINGFYADHYKIYQKRPIYWLFDSGKKNGFKALVYMHRYHPDTIVRMRIYYIHELQSRYRTAIEDLEKRINSVSTSERVKLNKQLSSLQEKYTELSEYEEKIHHLADQMIKIDLDDGVKHNYEIFKDVLAKIK